MTETGELAASPIMDSNNLIHLLSSSAIGLQKNYCHSCAYAKQYRAQWKSL